MDLTAGEDHLHGFHSFHSASNVTYLAGIGPNVSGKIGPLTENTLPPISRYTPAFVPESFYVAECQASPNMPPAGHGSGVKNPSPPESSRRSAGALMPLSAARRAVPRPHAPDFRLGNWSRDSAGAPLPAPDGEPFGSSLLIDREENRVLRGVLIGMVRETR
jgi:hypothetical protein